MSSPLVTIVIDTYNYGRFIEEAIDSVLTQDFPMEQIEILVVDDGSTDDTAGRVKTYGSRVQYLYKSNGGQASAFNLGLRYAQGDIVALLDADDYFLAGKVRRIVDEFQTHPAVGMIYHGRLELDTTRDVLVERALEGFLGFLPDDKRRRSELLGSPTSCLAFRRSIVAQVLPIPESITLQADGYLALLMVIVAPVIALPEPLSVYRIHGQNLFYAEDHALTMEQIRHRAEKFLRITEATQAWAEQHKNHVKLIDAHLFLEGLSLGFQEMRFRVDAPGRFRLFVFLLSKARSIRRHRSWKYTAVNYATALSTLIFGYEATQKLKTSLKRTLLRRLFAARRRSDGYVDSPEESGAYETRMRRPFVMPLYIYPEYGARVLERTGVCGWITRLIPLNVWTPFRYELSMARVRLSAAKMRKRFRNVRDLRVNLGCGGSGRAGWVNVDAVKSSGVDCLYDCRKNLPFPDGSVSCIFTEHFLEHVDYTEEAPYFISECLRVLKPGGVIRIVVADIERYLRAYCASGWDELSRLRPLDASREDYYVKCRYHTRMELINVVFRQGSQHKYAYDFATLEFLLRRYGFSEVLRQEFGKSLLPELAIDQPCRASESLYVEARKNRP